MDKTQETIGRGRRGDFNWKALSSCRRASPECRRCPQRGAVDVAACVVVATVAVVVMVASSRSVFDVSAATTAAAVNAAAAVRAPASHVGTC